MPFALGDVGWVADDRVEVVDQGVKRSACIQAIRLATL